MAALASLPDQLLNWAGWLFGYVFKLTIALLLLRAALDVVAGGLKGLFRRKRRTRKHR